MYLLAPALSPGSSAAPTAVNISQFGGAAVTLGQKPMATSIPVVIASDQTTFPVTVTFPATIAVTQSTSPWVISGTVTANAGTNLNTSLLALESGGNLAVLAGGVTSSVFQENIKQINGITPLMGNGVTGTGSLRVTIASDNTAFSVNATLTASSLVIGHVITDSGSTTAVTGNVTVVQGTASNLLAQVSNTGTFAVQSTPVTQADTFMLGGVNIKEINAITPLMGNGVTGTGSLRVTIASDNTAFAVNATLSAETSKVIGTVNQGTSPWIVSTKSALTASSPTAATVGVSSAQAVASNANRKGLILTNTSVNRISFGIGATAVLNSGITLFPGGTWYMDENSLVTGAINAIAGAASSNLAVQEFS